MNEREREREREGGEREREREGGRGRERETERERSHLNLKTRKFFPFLGRIHFREKLSPERVLVRFEGVAVSQISNVLTRITK